MKRIALIGHRGVGKTSLLARVSNYLGIPAYDLDDMIARQTGRSISDIFHADGEQAFRKLETSTLQSITGQSSSSSSGDAIVALGAGFPVDQLDDSWHAIWIRRATDETGRIFIDRPRLDAHITALEEFQQRKAARDPRFAKRADAVLFMDEGAEDASDPCERAYFTNTLANLGGALTVMPEAFARSFSKWAAQRLTWGLSWLELRDDLLSQEQITEALSLLPREKVLISLRDPARESDSLSRNCAFDWPAERGAPKATPTYLSLHARTGTLGEALEHLTQTAKSLKTFVPLKLKAALPVATFAELFEGDRWQREDPANRVFLPMSDDGRWSWYRLLRHNEFSLNFIRESSGSASDQPTLLQWARHIDSSKFAAILGDPVKHSRTPMEQGKFFRARNQNVLSIQMSEAEWPAIDGLVKLGLTDAAITAPLKLRAYEYALNSSTGAKELRSINTLHFRTREGTNTDLIGLQRAVETLNLPQKAAIWGGGGTLNVVTKVFPQAELVSVRTQLTRDDQTPQKPELVIWAASLRPGQNDPPEDWRSTIVLDLNYSEASAARDYAVKTGAKYISGLAMFRAQAQAQREFWNQFPPEGFK